MREAGCYAAWRYHGGGLLHTVNKPRRASPH